MNVTKSELNKNLEKLRTLLPQEERNSLQNLIPQGTTPLWEMWKIYVGEMIFLGRTCISVKGVKDSVQLLVRSGKIFSLEQVTVQSIKNYLRSRYEQQNWKPDTYNSHISKLSSFFKFLVEEERLLANPMRKIRKMSRQKENHLTLTTEQFNNIIGHLNIQKTGLVMLRDKVFFMLLGLLGCRRSEALKIELSDMNLQKGTLILHGVKGSKSRIVSLDSRLIYAITEYLRYRKKLGRAEENLFISATHRGRAWTPSGVRKTMQRTGSELGFKITSHAFRRFAATTLAEKGVKIEKIMQFLGHTSPRTTLRYINTCSPILLKSCVDTLSQVLNETKNPMDASGSTV